MAPTAPKKRTSLRSKAPKSGSGMIARPLSVHREGALVSEGFSSTKKDKRTMKHSIFVNRIEKTHRKPLKRRRPSKKLVTTMESLADALPDMDLEGMVREDGGKIKQKSLKSRPGAMKRREKLEKMERERFGKNMAQLAIGAGNPANSEHVAGGGAQPSATSSRWAALRGFISQTMEQKEEFKKP